MELSIQFSHLQLQLNHALLHLIISFQHFPMLGLGEIEVLEHVISAILEDLLVYLQVGELGLEVSDVLLHFLHEGL